MATNLSGGLTVDGVPVQAATASGYPVTGNVFYVNSATGVNDPATYGTSTAKPFATIAYAVTKCVSGDVIYVMAGHTESITAAGGITLATAGVTVVGLGSAGLRPLITLSTATTATFKITGANCTVRNLRFDGTGIDAIAKIFDVQAAGFWLDRCDVYFAKTGAVALKGLVVDSAAHANYLKLTNNYIHGDAAANCTNFVQLVGGDSIVIADNIITGNFTTSLGPINNITGAVTNITISGNVLANNTGSATKAIVLLTGQTGWIVNNRILIGSGTAPITADGCLWAGNYYAAAAATAGTLS